MTVLTQIKKEIQNIKIEVSKTYPGLAYLVSQSSILRYLGLRHDTLSNSTFNRVKTKKRYDIILDRLLTIDLTAFVHNSIYYKRSKK